MSSSQENQQPDNQSDDEYYDQDAEPSLRAPGDEGPTGVVAKDHSDDEDDSDSDGQDEGDTGGAG